MDTNEIMTNEEVVDVTEEIVKAGNCKGFMIAAGIGLAVIAGVIAYKYAVKPMLAKLKARKDQMEIDENDCPCFDTDGEDLKESEQEA